MNKCPNHKEIVFCICSWFAQTADEPRALSFGGAHHLASLPNLDKITQQSQLGILHFTIIRLKSPNFTATRLYCAFCPCKRCVESYSLVVRAGSHLSLPAIGKGRCDRLLTPRLVHTSPGVCLIWSHGVSVCRGDCHVCVCVCVERVGVRPELKPESFGLKLRLAQINGRCLLESTSDHNRILLLSFFLFIYLFFAMFLHV